MGKQKINEFLGLNTNTDSLDISEKQCQDCNDVIVDNYGQLTTRKGYEKYNVSSYGNPITALYDFKKLSDATSSLSTPGYSRYLSSHINDNYVYFVNKDNTINDYINIARSPANQLVMTWQLTNYDPVFRVPVISTTNYTHAIASYYSSGNVIASIRFNKTAMGTSTLTSRYTPDEFESQCHAIVDSSENIYILYLHKVTSTGHWYFRIDKMNEDESVYSNIVNQDLGTTDLSFTFVNGGIYSTTKIWFSFCDVNNELIIGTVNNDGTGYSATTYTGSTYIPINQVCLADSGTNFVGYYLSTTDAVSHSLYSLSCDYNGANLSLGTTLLDDSINLDMFSETIKCEIYSGKMYTAYCDNSAVYLSSAKTDGSDFSTSVLVYGTCFSPDIWLVGTNMYVSYISEEASGYKINLYRKSL